MQIKDNAFLKYLMTLALTLPSATAAAAVSGDSTISAGDKDVSFAPNVGEKVTQLKGDGSQDLAPTWRQIIWEELWIQIIIVNGTSDKEASTDQSATDVLTAVKNEDE